MLLDSKENPSRFTRSSWAIAVILFLLLTSKSAFALSASDANTLSSAFLSNFYLQSGTNGYFKDNQSGGVSYFWTQAEMIETVIDAYEWTGNSNYQGVITNLLNGFIKNNGSSWTYNMYNDDILWAVLAFARGGQLTGHPEYCAVAKANFDAVYSRAWDNVLGGGLYWTTDKGSKNACVNGPGACAASVLYQIYGDAAYSTKASNIYQWERSVLYNATSGAIADNIGTNGVISYWASTYNQGTFIGAANFLGLTNDAALAANYTMMNMSGGGLLPEYGIAGNNSGFNAIFLRWLMRFMRDRNLQGTYEPWLQLNANAAWNLRRADNLSWCQWHSKTPMGTNFYSWDCISSFSAVMAALPTQTNDALAFPRNDVGEWPLDSTSGTTAADVSANTNNGTVQGASWNASGRFNGCLTFNGVNSSVQVNNPLANDFSIAFWVKTTQTAGTGQWYNGAGLVDGDASGTKNDFGTALVGGKFGFGIGNPDTTILSSTSINDGAWHQCVATRQQITGAIKVYVDGGLRASGTAPRNTLNASTRLLFGAIASGNGFFNGSLDDVRLFSRTLSSSEVSALYLNATAQPSVAPTNLTAVAGNARVQLSWPEAASAISYNIKRALIDGGPYVTISNTNGTTFTDTTALNNRTYYYVVSASNTMGESTNSMQVSASPLPLAVWFKADSLSGLTSGTAVSLWPDSTGNGYDAIQTLGASRPTYIAGAINGMPAVRFASGSSSYLWFYRPVQDDFTMIFLYQSSQGISTGTSFWNGAGLINGEQSGTVSDFGVSLNASGQILAGTGNPDTSMHSGTGLNDGRPHVVTFRRVRGTGAIALYVDSTTAAITTGGTQSLTAPNTLVMGAQGVLNNFLSGDIAEAQIYSAALLDSDRLSVERALKCKYGLNGSTTNTVGPLGLTGVAGNRRISLNWTLTTGAEGYNLWRSTDSGATYQMIATGLTNSSYVDTTAANGQFNYYRVASANDCGAGALSAPLTVPLPLPTLSLTTADAGTFQINWPGWANDWQLYSATNLTPPIVWTSVTNPVGSNSGFFNVTVPTGTDNQFFRLSSP